MNQQDWSEYYKAISGRSPRPLFLEAVKLLIPGARVLELGAGDFVESKFLLDNGNTVDAIDSAEGSKELAKLLTHPCFSFEQKNYCDFAFEENKYDMVLALFSLPFHGKKHFSELFANIKDSLKTEGIFCGNFFGTRDERNTPDSDLIFHSKNEVGVLLQGLEVLKFDEIETDKETADGKLKHWHIFEVIAQKV